MKPLHDRRKYSPKKDVEDVFGGPSAWNDAPKATVQCANSECDGMEAAFFQVQIRSADEPMTLFYKVSFFSWGLALWVWVLRGLEGLRWVE